MKNKKFLAIVVLTVILTIGVVETALYGMNALHNTFQASSIAVKPVSSQITADGSIHSQNEATVHFSTGGKLTYLPVKEGDTVTQGQTIAQLDTYALQRELTQALNTYRSTRDTFDQAQENAQDNVLQNQQKSVVLSPEMDQSTAINDAVKRIIDQNQANLDNSVITVELNNYALQLATLTSPINGIVTHEDVTVANQIITPVTSFTVIDPAALVFRANVLAQDIDFVSVGAFATVQIDGSPKQLQGTVVKIYPDKTTLANGEQVYQVDIQSDGVSKLAYGQNGSVMIQSNSQPDVTLVPTWTILGHKYLWVLHNNQPILRSVTIGKQHDGLTEVLSGLNGSDRIITNPQTIAQKHYNHL